MITGFFIGYFIGGFVGCFIFAVIVTASRSDHNNELREECKFWKEQYLRVNEQSVEVSEFIDKNFTNSDGTIWHEDMKKIYNILGWSEDDENN